MDAWALVQVLGIAVAILALGAMVFVGWLDVRESERRELENLQKHTILMSRLAQDNNEVWAAQVVLADERKTPDRD